MSTPVDADEDLAFARLLLDAGRAEPLPSARTAAAFVTFAAGVTALRGRPLGSVAQAGATSVGAGSWAAAKWVTLGAVVGSVTTFIWLQHAAPAPSPALSVVAAPPARATAPLIASALAEESVPQTNILQTAAGYDALEPPATSASPPPRRPARARPDLAAEVTALDGIRTALAIGAWRDAEQQLAHYRREFPQGALRNEAEVLSITSLVAQGRKQAATSAGRAFLANHPRDPQAASVRALMK